MTSAASGSSESILHFGDQTKYPGGTLIEILTFLCKVYYNIGGSMHYWWMVQRVCVS